MKDLYQQTRAISPATIRAATSIVGGLFVACAGLIVLQALLGIFGVDPSGGFRRFLSALLQIGLSLGVLLAIYMIIRLLGESLMAQHRLNDRMTILTDELSSIRTSTPPASTKRKSAK